MEDTNTTQQDWIASIYDGLAKMDVILEQLIVEDLLDNKVVCSEKEQIFP